MSATYPAQANLFLVEALIDSGELESAREPMAAATALFRDKVEKSQVHAVAQLIQARFLSECGAYDAAHCILEETQTERRRTAGPDHPLTASVANRIGLNHLRRQDFARARSAFESVLGSEDHGEEIFGSVKHMARVNLAVVQLEEGNVAQALPALHGAACALPRSA